jgi:hypothetical protein
VAKRIETRTIQPPSSSNPALSLFPILVSAQVIYQR